MENISYNDHLHPDIANSPLSMEYKWILQYIMDNYYEGSFDLLLESLEQFCVNEEDYEQAAIVRDYRVFRKTVDFGIQDK